MSKNGGELAKKREGTIDEMEKRAAKAMEGARKYHKRMLARNAEAAGETGGLRKGGG